MGLFSSSKSSNSSTTNNLNQAFNQQTGASEGSIAFGAGSTGNSITTSDPATVKVASDAIVRATSDAIKATAETAQKSTKDALDFGDDALGFGNAALAANQSLASEALDKVTRTVGQANELLYRAGEGYAGKLLDNTGVAPQTIIQTDQKNTVTVVALAAAALLAFAFISRK